MHVPTVLVTAGGTATALSVLKGLRRSRKPVRVVLADCASDCAGRFLADGFALIPAASDPGFVDALLATATREGAVLVIPVFDMELPPLSEARQRFRQAGIRLAVAPPSAIRVCRDKHATAEFARSLGLGSPRVWDYAEASQADPAAYPLFGRPRDGRASIEAVRIDNPQELSRYVARVPGCIIQSYVDGPEATIDAMADASGRFLAACPRWRRVVKAGQSYKGETFDDPELVQACALLIERLGLSGPSCIQCFRLPNEILFTEINPRFGAATILSIHAGLNGPLYLLEETLGLPITPLAPRSGVRMLRWWQEVIIDEADNVVHRGWEP